ncbi:hypothetical protein AUK05_01090 [Candidatus Shapirobacteria bacterium CG2_30_35_20]|uniref:Uncharacterized protein n=2 Tax=Candidatus Shapironibacteriota TaxID=1752721 RepID=A0A1J5HSW9_9BACT|nr:MAG: hypothetical protein AUK05_01090 [Candidatus Shapirobacteria bacterium CG2_30_35_20]PIX67981.1 MAG: hypothetical protein COZ41_02190 [Candidatus Shapirobacteria bacterium CG_4_10_14_3_um_filter_35_13]
MYRSLQLKKYRGKDIIYSGIVTGNIYELKHSTENQKLVQTDPIDKVILGKVTDCGYETDSYIIELYEKNILIYDKPSIYSLLKTLFNLINKQKVISIPYENVLNWYIGKNQKYVAIESFLPDSKKDLAFVTYVIGLDIQTHLQMKIANKFSQEPVMKFMSQNK